MSIIKKIEKKLLAQKKPAKIVFPEGSDERIIKSAAELASKGIVNPVLLGNKQKIRQKSSNLQQVEVIDPKESNLLEELSQNYAQIANISQSTAEKILLNPLYFGAMMVKNKLTQGMVGGCVYTSGQMIAVSNQLIGLQTGIKIPSSFFLMSIPNFKGGESGNLIFSDPSMNINPTAEELAHIAISSAQSAKKFFGWQPKVAFLSFSTKGSADHEKVDLVVKAVEIAKKHSSNYFDGEFQVDTAINEDVAKRKISGDLGPVAGQANVLIFPDLNAANCGYKLVDQLAGAKAYGPILQGFAQPVSDLSRGASVEDISGVIILLSAWINSQ
jgi:phosphate acetyltransferase